MTTTRYCPPTVEQVRDHVERYPINDDSGLWLCTNPGEFPFFVCLCVYGNEVHGRQSIREEWFPVRWQYGALVVPCDQEGNPLPLVERCAKAEANYEFMVKRAMDEKLDGYRELGSRAAQAENERDEAMRELAVWRTRAETAEAEIGRGRMAMGAAAELSVELGRARQERDGFLSDLKRILIDRDAVASINEIVAQERDEAVARAEQAELSLSRAVIELAELERKVEQAERERDDLLSLLGRPGTPEGDALRALVRAAHSGWSGFHNAAMFSGSDERIRERLISAVELYADEHAAAMLAVLLVRSEHTPTRK